MRRQALRTISASGDPYAIGRALGAAAAPALRDVTPALDRFQYLVREWSGTDRARALEAAARAALPQHVREIEGIADGAGVPFGTLFLWNCLGDLPMPGGRHREESAGSTTLLIPPNGTQAAVIAHNQDAEAQFHGLCHIADVRPDDAPGFVSFYVPGLLPGHTFAVTRAGLVHAADDLRVGDERVGVPRNLVGRAVLDSERLERAVACIRDPKRASGFHHALGYAGERRLLSVEAPASGCAVVEAGAPRAHANHPLDERFAHIAQEAGPSSLARQRRADTLLRGDTADGFDPLRVLGDVGEFLPIRRRERDTGESAFTLATAVFRISGTGVEYEVFDDILHPPEHRGEVRASRSAD